MIVSRYSAEVGSLRLHTGRSVRGDRPFRAQHGGREEDEGGGRMRKRKEKTGRTQRRKVKE